LVRSVIEIFEVLTGRVHEVLAVEGRIEAPNWAPSGDWLMVNGDGRLFRVPLAKPALVPIDTGAADRCNNDHGISPDGLTIILSSHHEGGGSQIYVTPVAGCMLKDGGMLKKVSPEAPSWWHGISLDGSVLTYVAAREGRRGVDVFTLVPGEPERRLTQGEGHCDGPDFSADGTLIYYNCDRTGHAQIWVMAADGSAQRQLFADEQVNWFPHPSPDGRHLVYLAYPPGTTGHPADLEVALVLCDPEGGSRRRIRAFTGGQGTINVPSWSPDGSAFAYVRYEP
jgi:Tol biopolymer transport system component